MHTTAKVCQLRIHASINHVPLGPFVRAKEDDGAGK